MKAKSLPLIDPIRALNQEDLATLLEAGGDPNEQILERVRQNGTDDDLKQLPLRHNLTLKGP
ncbi:MAG: hypothetical protein QNL04_05410 [SAR324 cluster bacterium]|nr:hypothetical protein [SAR324 cluster bacterium]